MPLSLSGLHSETKIYNNRTIQLFCLRQGDILYDVAMNFWNTASVNVVTASVARLRVI